MEKPNITIIQKVSRFIAYNRNILAAIFLAILAFFFFLIIGFPEFFRPIHYFSQRWFGLGIVIIYLTISFILCTIQNWSAIKRYSIWFQTNLLFLFAIAYFLRVNNSALNFSTVEISTGLVFIPLSVFIFLVNKNLFGENRTSIGYNLGQVMLVSLCVFSLVYYIEIDNTGQRTSSNDLLLQIFRLPSYIWLTISATAVGLVSTLSLKLKELSVGLIIFFFFLITTIQTEVILNNLNLGYWAKTLILITVWDYLFNAILSFLKYPDYDKHRIKLVISTIYHIILLVVIFLFNYSLV